MTYLIVGETKKSQLYTLDILFEKYYLKKYTDIKNPQENADIHVLDGEGENSIGIEAIKDLQSELFFHPFEEPFQSAIIFQAEKLTTEAQNAFLKTLEESNDETIFILCVKNEKNLLPTIVSRSRKIFAKKITEDIEIDDIEYIDDSSIVELFDLVDKTTESTDTVLDFLLSLENTYRAKLKESIQSGEILPSTSLQKKLEDIHTSRVRILGNGNKRLVLENLILRLRK